MHLDELGLAHGTDKASNIHGFLSLYERRLRHLRGEAFLLVEIGVRHGNSMRMWSDYFPKAKIIGLDTDVECRQYEHGNVSIRIGDASDPKFLLSVIQEFGHPLAVLDDGSHRWDHQIRSLQTLFPILCPSGLYVVEDLDTSFEAHLAQAPFQGDSRISAFDYLSALARRVVADAAFGSEKPYDQFIQENYNWIGSVEFARRTCVLSKKPAPVGGPW